MSYDNKRHNQRRFDPTKSNQKPAHKPKPKRALDTHELHLLNAKRDGREMRFETNEGRIYGVVTNFDKFCVVVKDKKTQEEVVIFKHGLTMFTVSEHNTVKIAA